MATPSDAALRAILQHMIERQMAHQTDPVWRDLEHRNYQRIIGLPDDHPEILQAVAEFRRVATLLALAGDEDASLCGICTVPFLEGDPCLTDVDLGPVHAACCGPERESYVGPDGEPLKPGEPLPTPWTWTDHRQGGEPS